MKKILYIQYTNPTGYPPLEHGSRILAESGWKVVFLGTKAFAANSIKFPYHPNIKVEYINYCKPGFSQKLHYLKYWLWVLAKALLWKPVYIYASDLWSCPIAAWLSFIPGIKVIYHEHDSPSDEIKSMFEGFCLFMRRMTGRRAQTCILPNVKRLERFKKAVGRHNNSYCVWNCPRRDEVRPPRAKRGRGKILIHYHGNITRHRFPVSAIEALAKLPDSVYLNIVGFETIGEVNYIKHLKQAAKRLAVEDRIKFFDAMGRGLLYDLCSLADVGFSAIPEQSLFINERMLVGASNKVFDYLACGLALLVPDGPDWQKTYVEPGYGLSCAVGDPAKIASAFSWFLEHPEKMREMGERGRQKVLKDWNYEKQFEPVKQRLEKV